MIVFDAVLFDADCICLVFYEKFDTHVLGAFAIVLNCAGAI